MLRLKDGKDGRNPRLARFCAVSVLTAGIILSCRSKEPAEEIPIAPKPAPSASASVQKPEKKPEAKPAERKKCDPDLNPTDKGCPKGMANMAWYCIDRYENHLVVKETGKQYPYYLPPPNYLEGVVAKSEPCKFPQMMVTFQQAIKLCEGAGKRICRAREWMSACLGSDHKKSNGPCNKGKLNPHIMRMIFPVEPSGKWKSYHWNNPLTGVMTNGIDPAEIKRGTSHRDMMSLYERWMKGEQKTTDHIPLEKRQLVRTGEYPNCITKDMVFDMDGNLSEVVRDFNFMTRPDGGGYEEEKAMATVYGSNFSSFPSQDCMYDEHSAKQRRKYYYGFRCCSDLRN